MLSFLNIGSAPTPIKHCFLRIGWHVAYQWRVIRSALDWVVALYILIPAAGFVGYHYHLSWTNPDAWFDSTIGAMQAFETAAGEFTVSGLVVVLLLMITGPAQLRTFLYKADVMHIGRNPRWLRTLRTAGAIYTAVIAVLVMMLLLVLVAPFLYYGWGWTAGYMIAAGAASILLRLTACFAREFVLERFKGWRRWILAAALHSLVVALAFLCGVVMNEGFLLSAVLYTSITASVLILAVRKIQRIGGWDREIGWEHAVRVRWTAVLLQGSMDTSSRAQSRAKPMLLKRSQRLLRKREPHRVLSELTVKSLFRNRTQLSLYVQFASVVTAGLLFISSDGRWVLWLIAVVLMQYWVKLFAKDLWEKRWGRHLPIRPELCYASLQQAVFMAAFPGTVLFSVAMGAVLGWSVGGAGFAALFGVLFIPAGGGVSLMLSKVLCSWY